MEDAVETTYWCHMCSRSVIPVIEDEIFKCSFCQSGFVEEIADTQAADSDDDDDVAADDDQKNGGEIDINGQLEEIRRILSRHSADVVNLLEGIRARLLIESETNENVPSGSLGDYFIGPGYEMLLQRLAEIDLNNKYGTSPATKEAVEALATVTIEESLLQCTVCMDDFEIRVEAKEMPCKHKFHSDCFIAHVLFADFYFLLPMMMMSQRPTMITMAVSALLLWRGVMDHQQSQVRTIH